MTNITSLVLTAKVAFAVVTNVQHSDNASGCATCDGIRQHNWAVLHAYHDGWGKPYRPPTEKTVTTEVLEETTLHYNWLGQERSEKESKRVSWKRETFKLKEEWVSQSVSTNPPSPPQIFTLTNFGNQGIIVISNSFPSIVWTNRHLLSN